MHINHCTCIQYSLPHQLISTLTFNSIHKPKFHSFHIINSKHCIAKPRNTIQVSLPFSPPILKMGFQYFGHRSMRCGYDRLTSWDQKCTNTRRWVKCVNGRLRGVRLSKCRKLSVKAFSAVLMSSRIVRMYTHFVNLMESDYPSILLPTQWGLPVLSHPSVICRNTSVIPIGKRLTCYN